MTPASHHFQNDEAKDWSTYSTTSDYEIEVIDTETIKLKAPRAPQMSLLSIPASIHMLALPMYHLMSTSQLS